MPLFNSQMEVVLAYTCLKQNNTLSWLNSMFLFFLHYLLHQLVLGNVLCSYNRVTKDFIIHNIQAKSTNVIFVALTPTVGIPKEHWPKGLLLPPHHHHGRISNSASGLSFLFGNKNSA